MTLKELKKELINIINKQTKDNKEDFLDLEEDHRKSDRLLLEYINDPEVKVLYYNIDKWYA